MLKKVVLVIDDEHDIRQFASWVLEAEGYHVLQAIDGEEGLELAAKNHIDLVLLDVRMPRLDGWAVLEKMKTTPTLKNLPIVLFTASADIPNKSKALQLGVADYLVKPLSAKLLRKCVTSILTQRRNIAKRIKYP